MEGQSVDHDVHCEEQPVVDHLVVGSLGDQSEVSITSIDQSEVSITSIDQSELSITSIH